MDDEMLVFLEDEEQATKLVEAWQVLIVDDEPEIHTVTKFVLNEFVFEGRRLEFHSVYSGQEARDFLREHDDIALILLDVVMESEESGLELVHYIRRELGNQFVRIILRTGQPGYAPESKVIMEYDINDYKEKTELTSQRLVTALVSSLRSYRDLTAIANNKRGLEQIIKASPDFFRLQSLQDFANGVLTQLTSLLYLKRDALYLKSTASFAATQQSGDPFQILAATGRFEKMLDKQLDETMSPEVMARIRESLEQEKNIYLDDYFVMYQRSASGDAAYLIYLETYASFGRVDRKLMDIFCQHVSAAFENLNVQTQGDALRDQMMQKEKLQHELQEKNAQLEAALASSVQPSPAGVQIIVSACLAGVECRYDGRANTVAAVEKLVKEGRALPVCPEVLGGLSTPRAKAERQGERIMTEQGEDVSAAFYSGAKVAAEIARLTGCRKAILKAKSPTCGCGRIYDGAFSGTLIKGDGIFCALLKQRGIEVCSEEDLPADDD